MIPSSLCLFILCFIDWNRNYFEVETGNLSVGIYGVFVPQNQFSEHVTFFHLRNILLSYLYKCIMFVPGACMTVSISFYHVYEHGDFSFCLATVCNREPGKQK